MTHDQTEAMTLGDRIVIMKDGYIQQIGTPQEVFDRPANIFVAGFIGTPQMNFFEAELKNEREQYMVVFNGAAIPLTEEMNEKLKQNGTETQDILLGVRPEHMSAVSPDSAGAIGAKVDVSEMLGSEMYIHLTLNDQKDAVLRIPTLELNTKYSEGISYGSELYFKFSPGLLHLFSKENNKNLVYY